MYMYKYYEARFHLAVRHLVITFLLAVRHLVITFLLAVCHLVITFLLATDLQSVFETNETTSSQDIETTDAITDHMTTQPIESSKPPTTGYLSTGKEKVLQVRHRDPLVCV